MRIYKVAKAQNPYPAHPEGDYPANNWEVQQTGDGYPVTTEGFPTREDAVRFAAIQLITREFDAEEVA